MLLIVCTGHTLSYSADWDAANMSLIPSFSHLTFLYAHTYTDSLLQLYAQGKSGHSEDSICHMLTLYPYHYLMHRSGINTISPEH